MAVLVLSITLYASYNKIYKSQPSETVQVIEYSRSLTCLPQYIAMKKGYIEKQNLKIELKTATKFQDIDEALMKQKNCIILSGTETVVNYQSQDPVIFAGMTDREASFLLGRMDSSGFTPENVKGNSIITGETDSLQSMVLENILRGKKIWPNYEVNLMQNLPDNLKRGIFKSGTASFIVLKEPEVTLLEASGEGKTLLSLGTAGEMPAVVLACNRQFSKSHPQTVQKYSNAIYKAMLWMKCHSSQEIVALAKDFFPNLEQKVLITSIDRYKDLALWTKTPLITAPSYNNLLNIMEQSGELAHTKTFAEVVDNHFATEAIKNITYSPEEEQKKSFPFNLLSK